LVYYDAGASWRMKKKWWDPFCGYWPSQSICITVMKHRGCSRGTI
jgi:hypothetical protein